MAVEELGWKILPPGNLADWDGLMGTFMALVESDSSLIQKKSITQYFRMAKTVLVQLHDRSLYIFDNRDEGLYRAASYADRGFSSGAPCEGRSIVDMRFESSFVPLLI